MKVLVTCPPMLGMIDQFLPLFKRYGLDVTAPDVVQTLSVTELKDLVPKHHGWIIGDDPANREVFTAGVSGALKAAVKWGVGVDNVDFVACKDLGIPIENTPNMFGEEVADIAVGYVIALARETYQIDAGVRKGGWPKPRGISLRNKNVALIGLGDIGVNVARRLSVAGMRIVAYDPRVSKSEMPKEVEFADWPCRIEEADFIVITCALNDKTRHMIDAELLNRTKSGVRIVNVSRGPVINEADLESALDTGQVYSAALDVFETEPLPMRSVLRVHPRCVFGSHNASNTIDAVVRTSELAIEKLASFLGKA